MNIGVCIATYRRREQLAALLDDLCAQRQLPSEIVVVDNDPAASAYDVVERLRTRGAGVPIHYDVQPEKNIALTRNRTVELARADWLAFIDDDERAPPEWLELLSGAADRHRSDGVLGPVIPVLPQDAPAWIRRGHFYEWTRLATGARVPVNKLRFGNVLLKSALLRGRPGPFDPDYGLTGGEDGELLGKLALQGACFVWCDEAIVHEPVDRARLSLRWLLRRALRGGQDFARHSLAGTFGPISAAGCVRLFLRALVQSAVAAGLMAITWPAGRHRGAYWLLKASANVGKLSILLGYHYREYGPGNQ
jgi:succinoglycan biosynthesis protein ExoM